MLQLLFFSSVLADIDAPSIPNCPFPVTPECLIRNAQYTVVGTITGTNLGQPGSLATPGRYNATMNIRCMWASYSQPISPGVGLVGKDVLVSNWGFPKAGCPPNTGARATVNDTAIYFLYIGRRPAVGAPPEATLFSVQNICVGSIPLENKKAVEEVLGDSPENAISVANRGTDPFCELALKSSGLGSGGSSGGTNGSGGFTPSGAVGLKQTVGAFAAFLIAGVALTM